MAPAIRNIIGGHSVLDYSIKIECIKYTMLCAGLFTWAPVLCWLALDSGFRDLWEYRATPDMKERLFDALFIFFLVFGLLSMLGAVPVEIRFCGTHFFSRSKRAALHIASYGPDPHSWAELLCGSLTGRSS